jgi:tubulin-folding cofactor B
MIGNTLTSNSIMENPAQFALKLDATHSQTQARMAEIKYDARDTIAQVKVALERRFGSAVEDQKLQLQRQNGEFICDMNDDTKTLQDYGAKTGYCIHVIDGTYQAKLGEFDDVSKVEKFEISEAAYDKRDDTYRKFRERQRKANPNYTGYLGDVPLDFQLEESKAVEVG